MIEISSGMRIFGKNRCSELPKKFQWLIDARILQWNKKGITAIYALYTLATDSETGIQSIAIKLPYDRFSQEIGEKIVTGRIKRMLGYIRKPYSKLPNFIYIKNPCKRCRAWSGIITIPALDGICSNPKSRFSQYITEKFHTCEKFLENVKKEK